MFQVVLRIRTEWNWRKIWRHDKETKEDKTVMEENKVERVKREEIAQGNNRPREKMSGRKLNAERRRDG